MLIPKKQNILLPSVKMSEWARGVLKELKEIKKSTKAESDRNPPEGIGSLAVKKRGFCLVAEAPEKMRFIVQPKEFLQYKNDLKKIDFVVYGMLNYHTNTKKERYYTYVSFTTLSKECGYSRAYITESIKRMVLLGILNVIMLKTSKNRTLKSFIFLNPLIKVHETNHMDYIEKVLKKDPSCKNPAVSLLINWNDKDENSDEKTDTTAD